MDVLVIEDNQDVVDLVSVCINIRWPLAKCRGVAEGLEGRVAGQDSRH